MSAFKARFPGHVVISSPHAQPWLEGQERDTALAHKHTKTGPEKSVVSNFSLLNDRKKVRGRPLQPELFHNENTTRLIIAESPDKSLP